MRLYKQGSGKRHTHPPTTTHILGRFLHHGLRETETVQERASLGLKGGWIELFQFFISGIKRSFVHIVGYREFFDSSFELGNLFSCRSDDEVDGVDF